MELRLEDEEGESDANSFLEEAEGLDLDGAVVVDAEVLSWENWRRIRS